MFIIIIKYIYLHTDALHTCSGFEQHLASARAPLLHSRASITQLCSTTLLLKRWFGACID